jgi:hypothetical protein
VSTLSGLDGLERAPHGGGREGDDISTAKHAAHRRSGRRTTAVAALLVAVSVVVVGAVARETPGERPAPPSHPEDHRPRPGPPRAFSPTSWWHLPLPEDAPLHPHAAEILTYLRTAPENSGGCLRLAGAGTSHWGQPVYEAGPGDPEYDVHGAGSRRPPELARLRIPLRARPAQNSDRSMTVYDRQRGYVVALSGAAYDEPEKSWTATGATVTYLDSNGLHVATGRSNNPRNRGTHRGNNGATSVVTLAEIDSGVIRHVLKVAIGPEASHRHVFPMVGSDGDYTGSNPAVPPQGLRLRIKPSLDVDALDLRPDVRVIARALQRYGFYIGDSGGRTSLKLENTRVQGQGVQWHFKDDALCTLPFVPDVWDVVAEGYTPPRHRGAS